jgi:aspartate-semialdehyde dehydrogenase
VTLRLHAGIFGPRAVIADELRAALRRSRLPLASIENFGLLGQEGALLAIEGEPTVIHALTPAAAGGLDVLYLCERDSENLAAAALPKDALIIDLSGAEPSGSDGRVGGGRARVIRLPHPETTVVAAVARAAPKAALRALSVAILLPAAELGAEALEELLEQARSMLNFQEPPGRLFPAPLAFNTFRDAGTGDLETRIAREAAAILQIPCHVTVARSGIFHGSTYAFFLHFGSAARAEAAVRALRTRRDIRVGRKPGGATPRAAAAAASGILCDPPKREGTTVRLFATADSLRFGLAAPAVAETQRWLEARAK